MRKALIVVLTLVLLLSGSVQAANVTTLADLRQDVRDRFLVTTTAIFPDSLLDNFINESCREVSGYNVIEHVDSIVWVAATKYYDLPTDYIDFVALYPDGITGERAFDLIPASAVGKIAASPQLTTPEYIWIMQKDGVKETAKMGFYPVPSSVDTLILVYNAEAVELSSANDTTNIPYKYIGLVVDYTVGLCYTKTQEFNKGGFWFSFYDQRRNQKLIFDQKKFDYIIAPKVLTR